MKKRIFMIAAGLGVLGAFFYFSFRWQEQQALFNVNAMGRYIRAYGMIEGKVIAGLSDVPDVELVAHGHSRRFHSASLRDRVSGGYYYEFQRLDGKRFFIAASPLRPNMFSREFAIMDDMNTRVRRYKAGQRMYTYDEVRKWPVVPVWYDLRTVPPASK